MPITALPTPPQRSDPANFAARADAFFAALPTFIMEFNAMLPAAVAGAVTGSFTVTGNVGIGTLSPAGKLNVASADSSTDDYLIKLGFVLNTNSIQLGAIGTHNTDSANGGLVFSTMSAGTLAERTRLNAVGDWLVNTAGAGTSNSNSVSVAPGTTGGIDCNHLNGTASAVMYVRFGYNGGVIGSITQSGTTTVAYNTSSDYRLKLNPQPLTGSGAFIDGLQPKTWEWTADGTPGVGFIAHEVALVSPGSVVGEKDATRDEEYEVEPAVPAVLDEQGNEVAPAIPAVMGTRTVPVMQAMEYGSSEFIANIVAELQSLRLRVAALEAA